MQKIITQINILLAFYRCIVGKVWNGKGYLGTFVDYIQSVKFCSTVSIAEWHASSSTKEYEYSETLFCYNISLVSFGSHNLEN